MVVAIGVIFSYHSSEVILYFNKIGKYTAIDSLLNKLFMNICREYISALKPPINE